MTEIPPCALNTRNTRRSSTGRVAEWIGCPAGNPEAGSSRPAGQCRVAVPTILTFRTFKFSILRLVSFRASPSYSHGGKVGMSSALTSAPKLQYNFRIMTSPPDPYATGRVQLMASRQWSCHRWSLKRPC